MNIDTANMIETIIQKRNINGISFRLDDSEAKGEWFYKLIINCSVDKVYWIPHIEFMSKAIGNFFGEGLWFLNINDELVIS